MGFLQDANPGGFLNEEATSPLPLEGVLSTQRKEQDKWVSTGLTEAELEGLRQANLVANMYISEEELAPAGVESFNPLLAKALQDEAGTSGVQDAFLKEQEVKNTLLRAGQLTSVERALAVDPQIAAQLYKIESRAERMRNILLDKAEEFEDGAAGKVLELIDMVAYDSWAGMRDVVTLLSGEGSELSTLSDEWEVALRTMDDGELEEFLSSRLEDITSGWASGDEPKWRIIRELQALDAAGAVLWDEELGVLYGVMSAIDIATLGTTAAITGSRALRSAIGRLRSTAGTTMASEAAAGTSLVVRGGLDGEILDPILGIEDLRSAVPGTGPGPTRPRRPFVRDDVEDAVIIDDIMPRAYTSRTVNPNVPPVSAGYVASQFATNRFIQQFLNIQSKFGFGTFDISEAATRWATSEGQRLGRATQSGVIDFDVDISDIQQAKVTFKFGKDNSLPFTDIITAQKVAETIPNARVVPSGRNQWVIEAETLVPVKSTIDPLDLTEVKNKTWIGRTFGRASRGSSSFMSNLADASDFGALGFKETFKTALRDINRLSRKDINTIDDILTTLRDTPVGDNPRTWLTADQFANAYKHARGTYPSREVIQAYETAVEMSDFAWWVKANERLTSLANQKSVVVRVNGQDVFAHPPTHREGVPGLKKKTGPIWVWDVAQNRRVNVKSVRDEAPLLQLSTPSRDGSTYITGFVGNTRVPTLNDAFPYNAGGPRSNPGITWFVGNNDGNWATLIGARSERDARKAVEQYNRIVDAVAQGGSTARINQVIRQNRDWNPKIENLSDWEEFIASRGIKKDQKVDARARGERLGSVVRTEDQSIVDLNLEAYISYHRHDVALKEFGGELVENPNPLLAILTQYDSMISRGAQTQYRITHPSAWVKALERAVENGEISVPPLVGPMTDEMKVRTIDLSDIKGDVARKLRQEQSVINRRLDQFSGSASATVFATLGVGASNAAEWAVEQVHNLTPRGGNFARYMKETFVDQGNNKLLSLGFYQRMATPDQFIIQSLHLIPISLISPVNGPRAMTFATAVRNAARRGNNQEWNLVAKNLAKNLGISDQQMAALTEHMFASGRGYMRGAIAEDPAGGVGRSLLGTTKTVVSYPYYAGENFAATLSRVTAFFDTIDRYPTTPLNSRAFWNAVQERDRVLSFGLNNAQRSIAQSDSSLRVVTQWTSYPFRQIESMFFEKGLSPTERARLIAGTTMMWGVAGLGMSKLSAEIQEQLGVDMPFLSAILVDGVDTAIDGLLGVKIGDRAGFNPVELIERGYKTFADPFQTVPAFDMIRGITNPVLDGLANFGSGRWSLLSHDAQTLARAWKIVDSPWMAYTMMMEDARISRTGGSLEKEFTGIQEFFQAVGIKPSEATDFQRISNLNFSAKNRKIKAIEQATPVFKMALDAQAEGNDRKAYQLFKDADAIVQAYGLSPTRMAEVREEIFYRAGFERVNFAILEAIKNGNLEAAMQFKERMEGKN